LQTALFIPLKGWMMKLQYKYGLVMFCLGSGLLFAAMVFFYQQTRSSTLDLAEVKIRAVSAEIEKRLTANLESQNNISRTMALAPVLINELRRSNSFFAGYGPTARKEQIEQLSQHWQEAADENDPFVLPFLDNPVVDYLKTQQQEFPGYYGEIFVTNRYGVVIGATAKLSTLAHAHKYWWIGSYYNGRGRAFIDDRGYDASAQGYVLGTVVPIYDNGEVIGILKCNVNIVGSISNFVENYQNKDNGVLQLVRSGGKVVFQRGVKPLSSDVSKPIITAMENWQVRAMKVQDSGSDELIVMTPVELTKGSNQIGFGGSYESIDHMQGNVGEGWFVVMRHNLSDLMITATKNMNQLFIVGLIFSLLMAVGALLTGHLISRPIARLSQWASRIGKGDFHSAPESNSNDELGQLTSSFNHMVARLKETMISRDNLTLEVKQRKVAEAEALKALDINRQLIYQLKTTQSQMLHQEKMASIGQLAAGVAHEINNPIGFVMSNLTSLGKYTARLKNYNSGLDEILETSEVDSEVRKNLLGLRKKFKVEHIFEDIPELIDESKDGTERVSAIVQNLKAFSRIDEKELDLASINQCLDNTLKIVTNELKYKATILTDYGDIPSIECRPGELQQVFMNLLTNAGHSIEEKGEIAIKTWQKDTSVFIRISDTGKGIDKKDMTHIFEPFFTTKEIGKGTGLGLSISYDIVQKHNGSISVESTVGHGTSFTIELPLT
jgi:signal transduction histidine kinase